MEDYEEFVQRKLTEIRKNDVETAEAPVSRCSSNIRFYGVPVLAPLLNKDKKEDMQMLRKAAANVRNKRKSSTLSRVSYIQSILDAVQVQKNTTFEEFKRETRDTTQSNVQCQPENKKFDETVDSHLNSPNTFAFPSSLQVPSEDVPVGLGLPLTSTACDGHTAASLSHFKGVTSLENSRATVLFEGLPLFPRKLERDVDVKSDVRSGSEFVPHTDKHPHIDVSQLGVSSGYVTQDTSWLEAVEETGQVKTVTEGRHSGGFFLNSSALNSNTASNTIISHTPVDGEDLEQELPDSHQAQSDDVIEEGDPPPEPDPIEGPYRMSLQTLLKKSQEHRRRQRLLRNQTKVLKAGEGQEGDKHSLSDKENEELLPGGKSEMRKSREKAKEQGRDQLLEMKLLCLDAQIHTQGGGGGGRITSEPDSHDDTDASKCEVSNDHCLKTTHVSSTADAGTGKEVPVPSNLEPNMPVTSATTPTSTKSLYQSKGKRMGSMLPRPCLAASKNMKNIPSPKFCLSPVRSMRSRTLSDPLRKPLVHTPVCVEKDEEPCPCGPAKNKAASPLGETEVCKGTDQCEQIAQLELKLSSLKVLISDLESTLAESQTDKPGEDVSDRNGPRQTPLAEDEGHLDYNDAKSPCVVNFSEVMRQEGSGTWAASKQCELPGSVASLTQNARLPEAFRFGQVPERTTVLADTSNLAEERRATFGERIGFENTPRDTPNGSSLNRSYDVDSPSTLWCHTGSGWTHSSPELEGYNGVFRAKRRLLMNGVEEDVSGRGEGRALSATYAMLQRPAQERQQEHNVQIKTQNRQQRDLLQCLAAKYQYLQSVSFPCPGVGSRLEDMATSPSCFSAPDGLGPSSLLSELTLAQLSSLSNPVRISQLGQRLPVCHRPLLAAAVKGFLTRRLLRTERVAQLVRTVKDTQQFLQSFQTHTPGRENISRQDRALQERVALQLRAARYELHDLFFSLSPADRMQLISWDRHLARERELKVKEHKPQGRGKVLLSAATKKAQERKRMVKFQKKPAERTKRLVGVEPVQTIVPSPRRVPKRSAPVGKAR